MNKKLLKKEWVWIKADSDERLWPWIVHLLCDAEVRHALIVCTQMRPLPVIRY
jgi:hypothetical protein